ncbi:MAG: FtsX-like permease family protein [Bacteroidales bacterium]
MKSILLIFKGNYKNRKLQFFVVIVSMVLGITLLSSALGIIKSIGEPFDKIFNQLNASHILLYYNIQNDDVDKITAWFKKQKEVESISEPTPYVSFSGPLLHKGNKIEKMVQIAELTENHQKLDKIMVLDDHEKKQPEYGEIWIPAHLAQYNSIKIGDSLGIKTGSGLYNLKVTAFVVDPHFISGMMNPTRVWIAPGSLPLFNPVQNLKDNFLGVRLKNSNDIKAVWERFNAENTYSGSYLQYNLFKSTFMSVYQIISAILIVFSIFAVIIALFIVNTTTSGQIYADYKLIGIFKSIGFTPKNVLETYVIQFALLSIISIPVGLSLSYGIVRMAFTSILHSVGLGYYGLQLTVPFTTSSLLILALVLLVSYFSGKKAAKIKPALAIRFGMPVRDIENRKGALSMMNSKLPLTTIMGIRFIINNKKRSFVSFLSFVFVVFIVVFSINVSHSFVNLKNNRTAWGFDNGDLYVVLKQNPYLKFDRLIESLKILNEIEKVKAFNYQTVSVLANNKSVQDIFGKIFSGNLTEAGLVNLEGRHPQTKDEIAICSGTAILNKKTCGDSISIKIEGEIKNYKIVGIYQDVSNLGQGFRMHESALKELNPLSEPDNFILKLKPGVDVEELQLKLKSLYGSTINIELPIEEQQAFKSILGSLTTSLNLIAFFFIIILIITIWNDLIINIRDYLKTFGILKTLGFTPLQLRLSLIWRIIVLFCLSLLVGIPFSLFLSPAVMGIISQSIGLRIFPFESSVSGTLIAIPILLIIAVLSSWIVSGKSTKVNSRILIAE